MENTTNISDCDFKHALQLHRQRKALEQQKLIEEYQEQLHKAELAKRAARACEDHSDPEDIMPDVCKNRAKALFNALQRNPIMK